MKTTQFSIKKTLIIILAAVLAFGTGCGIRFMEEAGKKQSFTEFTNRLFREDIAANTLNLHYTIENPAAYGIKDYPISLGSYTSGEEEAFAKELRELQLELYSYGYTDLSLEEQLTYDIFKDYLDTQLALNSFSLYSEPLSFSNGMQMQLPILLAEYEFKTEQDVKDYLQLLAIFDDYIRDLIEFEKDKAKAGLFMSDELCHRVIDSCEAFLAMKDNHYLISTFENRLEKVKLSESSADSYIAQNKASFQNEVIPAYELLIKELSSLLGSGKNSGGICNFKDGKRYYELLVYSETGCDDSIKTILSRIEEQRTLDLLVCADLQEKDPAIWEKCTGLKWTLSDEYEMLDLLQEEMLADFPQCPETNYSISFVDPALEDYLAPAFYIVAPIDNYKDNSIFINNANDSSDIYYYTTLAHEGFPGHLYQTVMSYEYGLMPIRSSMNFSGYVEGWATYIEMMAYHYGNLDPDVAAMLSHNQSAILSLYASSDIGIHYLGWTGEDMYNFWSGYGISNRDTIKEITALIVSEPGNYLKYYVGYLEFLELKDFAKKEFGSDYSTVEFHRAVLDIGPAPFHIIEDYLDDFYKKAS